MAVTMTDLVKTARDDYNKKFIIDLARHKNAIWPMFPIETIGGLKVTGSRVNSLPTTGKRKLGGSWTASTGRTEEVQETLSIYGGEIEVDTIAALVESKPGIPGQLELQTQLLRESMMYTFNNDFVNGDHGVDPDGLEGLSKRVTNGLSRYDLDLYSGASLDVLGSIANANKFLNAVHAMIGYLGGVDVIVCNEKTRNGFGQTLRYLGQGNLLSQTKDNFERTFETFMGAPIVDIGYKSDFSTEIITNTKSADTLGSEMYLIRKGGDEGLNLIQLKGSSPEPKDAVATTPKLVRRVEWALGLMNNSRNSSIGRIKGFKAFPF